MCQNNERCGRCDGLREPVPAECREPCMALVPIDEAPRAVLDRAMADELIRETQDA